jgi:hypothetical protein
MEIDGRAGHAGEAVGAGDNRLISSGLLPAICIRSGKRKKLFRVREEALNRWILSRKNHSAVRREKKQLKAKNSTDDDEIIREIEACGISLTDSEKRHIKEQRSKLKQLSD